MRVHDPHAPADPTPSRWRRLPPWALVLLGALSVLGVIFLLLVGLVVWGVIWATGPSKEARPYLDALVARNYAAAHALRCAEDRRRLPLGAFAALERADPLVGYDVDGGGRSSDGPGAYRDVARADVVLVREKADAETVELSLVEEEGRWRVCDAARGGAS